MCFITDCGNLSKALSVLLLAGGREGVFALFFFVRLFCKVDDFKGMTPPDWRASNYFVNSTVSILLLINQK